MKLFMGEDVEFLLGGLRLVRRVDRNRSSLPSHGERKDDLRETKTTQSRQKSYTYVRRRPLEFEVDDWVYLKVSPMKGGVRFGKKGKLSPRVYRTL